MQYALQAPSTIADRQATTTRSSGMTWTIGLVIIVAFAGWSAFGGQYESAVKQDPVAAAEVVTVPYLPAQYSPVTAAVSTEQPPTF